MKAQSSKQDSLLAAVKANNLEETKKILNNRGLPLDQDFSDYKLLIQALILGHKKIAKLLLDHGCRVFSKQKTNTYNTPLYYAVKLKCLELVKILLDKGASIKGKDANKETPLAFAMKNKYFEIVDLMLSNYKIKHTNINNEDEVTHFHIAVMRNNTKLVKTFLEHGMKVDQVSKIKSSSSQGYTPLHFAVEHHACETVKLLLSNKANFGSKNAQGCTPLHLAFYLKNSKENDEIINLILSAHLKNMINPIDNNGVSHFHIACCTSNLELLKTFVKSGADCNTCIFCHSSFLPGYAPLHIAVTYKHKKTVQFLLDNKADVNKAIGFGVTPLHLAVESENIEIVKLLLQYNADVCATDSDYNTPIHKAFGDVQIIETNYETRLSVLILLFSTHQGNLKNVSNKYGISLFHIACTVVGYPQLVENFLKQNVNINACVKRNVSKNNCPGFSALHFAVIAGNLKAIQILMKHNIALKMINSDDHSPLFWVCKHWFDSTITIIGAITAASPTKTLKDEDFKVDILNKLKSFDDIRHQILKLFLNRNEMYDYIMYDVCEIFYYSLSKEVLKSQDKMFQLKANQLVNIFKIIMMTLMDHGYDVNKKFKSTSILVCLITSLSIYYSDSIIEFIELLLIRGAQVDIEGDNGITPLMMAATQGLDEVVEILLKYKANPNKYSTTRNTALHMALLSVTRIFTADITSSIPKIVDLLVAKGAKVDVQNSENYTPLHYAAEFASLHKSLVCLLEHNCKVDSKNCLGDTALHIACINQNLPGLKTLLDYGADINLVNKNNFTPLELMFNQEYLIFNEVDKYEMLKLLELHIIKLNCIGFKVSKKNNCAYKKIKSLFKQQGMMLFDLEPVEDDFNTYDENNIFIDFCERELERMKNIKIDMFTSLYSIIFKNAHEVSKNVNSENFKELVNSKELKKNFPLYGYIINLQYKKGLKRYILLKPAKDVLQTLLTNLPYLCYDHILASFTNQELKKLTM